MKNEGKREKFLLSFFIAVVFLLIVQYVANIYEYNIFQNDPKQFLSNEIVDNGIQVIRDFFIYTYGVDINSNPGIIGAANIIYSSGMITDLLFNFICSVITLTTIIYLILIIKIENFKEYWKDLFKAFLIILAVFLFTEIFGMIHYNFFVVASGIEFTISILGTLVVALMAWGTMIVGNLILNCKRLKLNKKK